MKMSITNEISLYEVHRKPHEVVIDDSLIAVSPRALHAELMCPICLDLMRNTQTTKECLHRFCQECIITALRSGNKECPTCRKKLVSKRSLRPDPNFDALIAKIYPNREELLQQEKQRSIRPSLHHNIHKRKRRDDPIITTGETPPSSRASTPQAPLEKRPNVTNNNELISVDSDDDDDINIREDELKLEFQLRPNPNDDLVTDYIIRNLCATPQTTVAHLINYLQIIDENYASSTKTKFKLSVLIGDSSDPGSGTNFMSLTNSVNLKQICEKYWIPCEKLKLFFSLNAPDSN